MIEVVPESPTDVGEHNKYKARRIHFEPEIWTVGIGGIEFFTCIFFEIYHTKSTNIWTDQCGRVREFENLKFH